MTMLSDRGIGGDLSRALEAAQNGDSAARETLFRECYPKVLRAVRRKFRTNNSMRSLYDSTDFASDVMKSLAANLDHLSFPTVDHLVAFLARVAEQKVIDEHRKRHTLKRDVSRERRIHDGDSQTAPTGIASDEPTASQLAQANEVEERLFDRQDEVEKQILRLRREGHDNTEIADQIGWNIRKIQRFLKELHDSLRNTGS